MTHDCFRNTKTQRFIGCWNRKYYSYIDLYRFGCSVLEIHDHPGIQKKAYRSCRFYGKSFFRVAHLFDDLCEFHFIYCGIDSWIAWNREYDAYVNGECKIVEGVVEDFHPLPSGGHDSENFTVSGVKFAYASTPGSYSRLEYDKCMIHGGCITGNGMKVKIWYLGDGDTTQIMRIDILDP